MPVLVVQPASTATGPTRRRYRRLLAEQLGWHLETTVTDTAVAGETARVVLADEIRDDETGWAWAGQPWLYVQTGEMAGTQRRVIGQADVGYRGADGMLMLSRPLDAALAVGDVIEVTSPLPARSLGHVKGLDAIVNEALERSWVEASLELVGDGTDQHSLDAYPFLDLGGRQLSGVADTRGGASSDAPRRTAERMLVRTVGAERMLVTEGTHGAGQTFWLDAIVRGDRLVHDGIAWGYPGTPGLQSDTDMAAVPERWVVTIGMVKALQELTKMAVSDPRIDPDTRRMTLADLSQQRQVWAAAAAQIVRYEMPKAGPGVTVPFVTAAYSEGW